MKKDLVIIKLGGSVITDKSKARGGFRKSVIRRLAKEILDAKKKKDFDLILVHGAGAYAHYLTKKYRIAEGYLGGQSAVGYAHIKNELFRLNNLVWSECLLVGLAVCTVQPSAVIFTENGRIKNFDMRLIEVLLKMGIAPLLLGDDTIDEKRGIAILSGDKTMAYLARKFAARKVIFVSDVEGVFNKNPKIHKDAKLIKEINNKNFRKIIGSMEIYNKNDASGEMKGKLLAIAGELKEVGVRIVSGLRNQALKEALLGRNIGTKIKF